jgi:hypothetical protein
VVIIAYDGATAQATGGTITVVNNRVIHTFTANGVFNIAAGPPANSGADLFPVF